MALGFVPSDAAMIALQAGVVAAPRMAPGIQRLDRLRGPGWALVPVASIVGVIFAIRYASDTAGWLTWLALVAVPPLAAASLGWAGRGARWWLAIGAAPLFVLAWRAPHSLAGEGAASVLSALSCVTLGVLLAAVAPGRWLKLGIVAMSAADVWLVTAHLLQAPNTQLVAAHPAGGLPKLQSELFGSVSMGYGDMFVAGVLGAVLAADRALQRRAAVLTFMLAGAFDLLFFVVDELPATVPVAGALVLVEAANAWRRRSRRAAVTPQPAR